MKNCDLAYFHKFQIHIFLVFINFLHFLQINIISNPNNNNIKQLIGNSRGKMNEFLFHSNNICLVSRPKQTIFNI